MESKLKQIKENQQNNENKLKLNNKCKWRI